MISVSEQVQKFSGDATQKFIYTNTQHWTRDQRHTAKAVQIT